MRRKVRKRLVLVDPPDSLASLLQLSLQVPRLLQVVDKFVLVTGVLMENLL
jgi:hypothetical protein